MSSTFASMGGVAWWNALLSLRVLGLRILYLELGILHPSFGGLKKGTDLLHAVIRSSYYYTTVHRALRATIASMGGVCFRNGAISRMCKSAMQFQNRIPVSKLVCNLAISNLHSSIMKLHKFANCTEHIYIYSYLPQKWTLSRCGDPKGI